MIIFIAIVSNNIGFAKRTDVYYSSRLVSLLNLLVGLREEASISQVS